jgi:hypothetical protein
MNTKRVALGMAVGAVAVGALALPALAGAGVGRSDQPRLLRKAAWVQVTAQAAQAWAVAWAVAWAAWVWAAVAGCARVIRPVSRRAHGWTVSRKGR